MMKLKKKKKKSYWIMSCEGFNFILSHKDVIWELWENKRTKSIKLRVGGSYEKKKKGYKDHILVKLIN